MPVHVIPATLGWANPDTGPEPLRVYALDAGPGPRWARPHARVLETALIEAGGREGERVVVVALGRVHPDVLHTVVGAVQVIADRVVAELTGPPNPD